jgi:hypothetical protein
VEPRPLQQPRPVYVQADPDGRPLALQRRGWPRPVAVARIQDRWRIDDEWWREQPIARLYHLVLLVDGTVWTIYHDLLADAWFAQIDRDEHG